VSSNIFFLLQKQFNWNKKTICAFLEKNIKKQFLMLALRVLEEDNGSKRLI
jgi:hypothetical protein